MKIKNVTYITKDGFIDYWNSFYTRYCELKQVKNQNEVPKENVIHLIGLLKSEGFEMSNIHTDNLCGRVIMTVHYGKLFQSYKKRCNYEIVVKLTKYDSGRYTIRISKMVIFPRSKNARMSNEITLYMHDFLNN